MSYGLPGRPDYEYARPFDYLYLEFVAGTANAFESIFSRGLLVGTTYELGSNYRGIRGLYGICSFVARRSFASRTPARCSMHPRADLGRDRASSLGSCG